MSDTLYDTNPVWIDTIRHTFGYLPDDYLIFDAETSGVVIDEDVALQIGQAVVRNRQCVYNDGVYVNWFNSGLVDAQWLTNRIQTTAQVMQSKGHLYQTEIHIVKEKGIGPLEALESWADTIQQSVDAGMMLVGHNIVAFDLPLLCKAVFKYLNRRLLIPPELLWDTGMIEKSRLLDLFPLPSENKIEFFRRVHAHRSFAKWSLSNACAQRFNLWYLS